MMWPPSLLRVRIQGTKRRFGLWLPLFLAWPPLVLLALAFLPFVLILAALLWPTGRGRPLLLAGPLFFGLFCSLRGLMIDVQSPSSQVHVSFR